MYAIEASNYFLRRANKFFKKHPDLKKTFTVAVDDLRKDPFQPHLELHGLGGKLQDCYAVRLTYSYPAPWHPPAPAGGGKRLSAREDARVSSSGRSRYSGEPPAPAGGGSTRITLTLMVTEKEIVLLDIGSHDEVYK